VLLGLVAAPAREPLAGAAPADSGTISVAPFRFSVRWPARAQPTVAIKVILGQKSRLYRLCSEPQLFYVAFAPRPRSGAGEIDDLAELAAERHRETKGTVPFVRE
jgi:hypothetical protein